MSSAFVGSGGGVSAPGPFLPPVPEASRPEPTNVDVLGALRFRIATFQNVRDNQPKSATVTWGVIKEAMTTKHEATCTVEGCAGKGCESKLNGLAWSPTDYAEGVTRANDNVRALTLLVLDLDHVTRAQLVTAAQRVEAAGFANVYHSTHNHKPQDDDWCVRIVFPLSRPVLPSEWARFWSAAVDRMGIRELVDPLDDPHRIYFLPNSPKGAPFAGSSAEGTPIDVDALLLASTVPSALELYPGEREASASLPTNALALPPQSAEGVYNLAELRKRLEQVGRPESHALMEIVLKGDSIGPHGPHPALVTPAFPDGYGGQDKALVRIAGVMAGALPTGTPIELMLEILRPSLSKTVNPGGFEELERAARAKLEKQIEEMDGRKAEKRAVDQAITDAWSRIEGSHVLTPTAPLAPSLDAVRPTVQLEAGKLAVNVTGAGKALAASGVEIFSRGTVLVRPVIVEVEAAHGRRTKVPQLSVLSAVQMRDLLSKNVQFIKMNSM